MATMAKISKKIGKEDALAMFAEMVLIRRFEERCVELYSAGKIRGFLHLYIGEEAVAAGAIPCFTEGDRIVATYREHGHAIVRGISPDAVMAEMFGKASGCSRGRGGSMHLFDSSRNFYGGNAIVAGGLPLAVGLALADRMSGAGNVTGCFFGDGAVAEGEFHESLNLAALWNLPVVFVCENNLYAMGTALTRHQSQPDIAKKAEGYGIEYERVDGMDVIAVREAARRAVAFARNNSRPFFLVANTYRFRAHSMYDPDLYRTKAEIEAWKERCPVKLMRERLVASGIANGADLNLIERGAEETVREAVDFAEAGELEPVADLAKDVYTPKALA